MAHQNLPQPSPPAGAKYDVNEYSGASAPDGGAEVTDNTGALQQCRNRLAGMQATGFANLGGAIASCPVPFAIITLVVFTGLGVGVMDAYLETKIENLWVNKGGRLDEEKANVETHWGSGSRYQIVQLAVNGKASNLSTAESTEALADAYYVDSQLLDMRYFKNTSAGGGCSSLPQSECSTAPGRLPSCATGTVPVPYMDTVTRQVVPQNVNTSGCGSYPNAPAPELRGFLCTWDATSSMCLDSDDFGLAPSSRAKQALTYTYKGLEWGLRELCPELNMTGTACILPTLAYNIFQKTDVCIDVTAYRSPCSSQVTIMDCFLEPPPSIQILPIVGILTKLDTDADNVPDTWVTVPDARAAIPTTDWDQILWKLGHNTSYTDVDNRGQAMQRVCQLWSGPLGGYAPKGYVMGGTTSNEDWTKVETMKALQMGYPLLSPAKLVKKWKYIMEHPLSSTVMRSHGYPESLTEQEAEDIIIGWEKKAHSELGVITSNLSSRTDPAWLNKWGTENIIEEVATRNEHLVIVGFCLLAVVVWAYLFRCDKVNSRLFLGCGAVLCIAVGVFGTLGLSALCQIDFNAATLQILPYVAMGLGIDDMFVLVHYYVPLPTKKEDVGPRMAEAYSKAGPSVLTTSLVNLIVFLMSAILPLGAVRSFAFSAAIAVFVNFSVIFFAFGALLALDGRRIAAGRLDCAVCVTADKGANEESDEDGMDFDKCMSKCLRGCASCYVGTIPGRIIIIFMWLGVVSVTIALGCTDISLGLPLSEFVEEGSVEHKYLSVRDTLLPNNSEANGLISKPATWEKADYQASLTQLVANLNNPSPDDEFEKSALIGPGKITHQERTWATTESCWWLSFRAFVAMNAPTLMKTYQNGVVETATADCTANNMNGWGKFIPIHCVVDPSHFYGLLGMWCGAGNCTSPECAAVFTANPPKQASGAIYCDDLALETALSTEFGYYVTMINSHYTTLMNSPADSSDAELSVEAIKETRDLTDNSGLGHVIYPYGGMYLVNEQYLHIEEYLVIILTAALCMTLVILTLLFQSFTLALIQSVVIGGTVAIIVGSLPMLNMKLNGFSLMSIVFGVSINVELCVHIARAFDEAEGTKSARAVDALGQMGPPVFCGAATTILSVVVLGFSDTAFLRKYYCIFYINMVWNSLISAWTILPVLLAIFGPDPVVLPSFARKASSVQTRHIPGGAEMSPAPLKDAGFHPPIDPADVVGSGAAMNPNAGAGLMTTGTLAGLGERGETGVGFTSRQGTAGAALQPGDNVQAYFDEQWHAAKVHYVHANGKVDVIWADQTHTTDLPGNHVRPRDDSA